MLCVAMANSSTLASACDEFLQRLAGVDQMLDREPLLACKTLP
jgi:hypothetical protein